MKIDRQDKPVSSPSLKLVTSAGERDRAGDATAVSPSPFRHEPPDYQLFLPGPLQAALDAAEQAVRNGDQVVLIEGEQGAGKTVFLRRLAQQFEAEYGVCHIEVRLALGERHVLGRIAEVYLCPPVRDVGELASLLVRQSAGHETLLLIVDNAERLSCFALRALLELKQRVSQGGGRLVLVISTRVDALDATLALPVFAAFGNDFLQRIVLPRFSAEDTAEWLHHLIEAANLQESVSFDSAQIRRIHKASHGLPRQIRRVADDLLNGRKPRPWRSRHAVSIARQRKNRLVGVGVSIAMIAGVAWLAFALVSGPPRVEIAFDFPLFAEALSDQPSSPLPSAEPIDPPHDEVVPEAVVAQPPPSASSGVASPSPLAVTSVPASRATSGDTLTGRAWLMAQAPDRYSVQLASSPDRALAERFIERNPLQGKTTVIATQRGDRTLYLVIHGSFAGPAEAREAIAALPPQIRRNDPFARPMRSLQAITIGR